MQTREHRPIGDLPPRPPEPRQQRPPQQKKRRPPPSRQRRSRRKRRPDPFTQAWNGLKRFALWLPFPRMGKWGAPLGIVGMFGGCLAISIVFALTLRTTIRSDAFNPFEDDYGILPTATPFATPNPEFEAEELVGWQGTDRVTILVMGTDTRPDERGYRTRTDTMILMSVDPVTKRASMLSMPRDLYVEIPGHGLNRINSAYPFGGANLAAETVQYNLGVPVDYYAIIEFEAFTRLVDEIGGIDLYVPETLYDATYPDHDYGYDPFYIEAGQHHLDGETALKYARTRHTDNDYERARRQQAVIMAIRDKIVSFEMLPTLIERAPTLYTTLGDTLRTNLTLDQMIELALLVVEIPDEDIRRGVIDSNYVSGYRTEYGASVLIPNRAAIGPLIEYVFWLD